MSLANPAVIVGIILVFIVGLALVYRWRRADIVTVKPTVRPNSGPPLAPDDEIRHLLAAGNKLGAIKRVRELTGLDLKAAKEYVEAQPAAPSLAGLVQPSQPTLGASALAEEARRLMREGDKLVAIKHVREVTGMGLKEAKDFVERL